MQLYLFKSENNLCYIATLDDNLQVVGKGKTLLIVNITNQTIFNEVKLDLLAEIRDLYKDKDKNFMFVSTDVELKTIGLKKKKSEQDF